jgi:DNA-binding NtrC family response regulator
MLSFHNSNVFIVYKNDDINSLLAGTFWLNGVQPFKFSDGKEGLKKFRELDGKVDVVVVSHGIALDNDLLLIVNIKKINPNTKVLVIAEDEESRKNNNTIYEYGADEIVSLPLNYKDISDKLLLLISKRNLLERPTNKLV